MNNEQQFIKQQLSLKPALKKFDDRSVLDTSSMMLQNLIFRNSFEAATSHVIWPWDFIPFEVLKPLGYYPPWNKWSKCKSLGEFDKSKMLWLWYPYIKNETKLHKFYLLYW